MSEFGEAFNAGMPRIRKGPDALKKKITIDPGGGKGVGKSLTHVPSVHIGLFSGGGGLFRLNTTVYRIYQNKHLKTNFKILKKAKVFNDGMQCMRILESGIKCMLKYATSIN